MCHDLAVNPSCRCLFVDKLTACVSVLRSTLLEKNNTSFEGRACDLVSVPFIELGMEQIQHNLLVISSLLCYLP